MLACICGGILEVYLGGALVSVVAALLTMVFNRGRCGCNCNRETSRSKQP